MNLFKQLVLSLYSPITIRNFRFQNIGKTITYIFLLSFLSIFPLSIQLLFNIKESLEITPLFLQDFITNNHLFLSTSYTVEQALPFLLPFVLLVLLFFSSFSYFLMILLFSLIPYFLMIKENLPYKQLFTITTYSLTFPTVLFTILEVAKLPKPSTLFLLIAIFFIVATVRTFPKRKRV